VHAGPDDKVAQERQQCFAEPATTAESAHDTVRTLPVQVTPLHGSRQMTRHLQNQEHAPPEKRIRRLMRHLRPMPIHRPPWRPSMQPPDQQAQALA
jgi:hypothetical protein